MAILIVNVLADISVIAFFNTAYHDAVSDRLHLKTFGLR